MAASMSNWVNEWIFLGVTIECGWGITHKQQEWCINSCIWKAHFSVSRDSGMPQPWSSQHSLQAAGQSRISPPAAVNTPLITVRDWPSRIFQVSVLPDMWSFLCYLLSLISCSSLPEGTFQVWGNWGMPVKVRRLPSWFGFSLPIMWV